MLTRSILHELNASSVFTIKTQQGPKLKVDSSWLVGWLTGRLGTNLNQELYYKITCHKDEGYCLLVANCTVSTGSDQKDPYIIIDSQGCTTEPSLFEHVEVS